MITRANRLQALKPSPTLAMSQRAKELRDEGRDIIDLTVGEPDFDTPDIIKQAAVRAIQSGFTKYTAVDGIPELKKAIQHKFKRDNNLDFDFDQILVSNGAKQNLFNIFFATLNAGDEVIIPAPYWVSYPAMVEMCEGVPIYIKCSAENQFKMTADQLKVAITPKTKWVIYTSPNNPTGSAYTQEEIQAITDIIREHPHVGLISDEIYEELIYKGEHISPGTVAPDLLDRMFIVNGVSKSYAMTGWRIGYSAGPKDITKAMNGIQSHTTSNPCSISQKAALQALTGDNHFLEGWRSVFKERRDFFCDGLNTIKGIKVIEPAGAFYVYADVSGLIGHNFKTDTDIALNFMERGVATVPGAAFGLSPYIRMSYATSMENLGMALKRMKD